MLRILFLMLVILGLFGCSGCVSNIELHPVLSGPQLASKESYATVALVSDMTEIDPVHSPFCSAVWVGHKTILTANHCLEGYASMYHRVGVIKALEAAGFPEVLAILFVQMGIEDLDPKDPRMTDNLRNIWEIIHSVPPTNPDNLTVPFIVQSEVVDIGVAPTQIHYSRVLARAPKEDLALLEVRGECPKHGIAELAGKAPLVGAKIESVGHVRYNYWFYREGVVGAYRHDLKESGKKDLDGPFMQITAPLSSGDSGGGTFNEQGQLVGINSFLNSSVPGAYCIHLDTIRGFLAGQHIVPLTIDTTAKDPDLKDDTINLE